MNDKTIGIWGKKVAEKETTWILMQYRSYISEKSVPVLQKKKDACMYARTQKGKGKRNPAVLTISTAIPQR